MEFLTAIASGIAGEIAKSIYVPIKRHVSYFIFYNRNIKNLEDTNKKLGDKKVEAKEFMNDADRKFKKPIPSVPHWHDDAEKLNENTSRFLETITVGSNKCCQTPWSRYSLSRKAFKMTGDVTKKLREAPAFGDLAYDVPLPHIGSTFNIEGLKDFDSRLSLVNEILKALRDDKLNMISICGMGGVGKTTLAKKIVRIVESEKLFDLVAITTVSQKPDLNKIQSDIMSCFGWQLEQSGRARMMRQKFMESNKSSLLVFDDVWKELNDEDFEAIGLPSTSAISGCKIILTSRKVDVCNRMGSQKNFPIAVLSDEEAWSLFKEMALVGNSIDNQDLHHTARQISDECGGLPIAIVTVAKALKNKKKEIWNDALLQLKNANPEGISGMEKAVYSRIELSYNLLERKEARSCFLLCCLFPEDHNVPIELLVWYGMGLRLFQNVDNLEQARDRVHVLIDELRESFLLLDGDDSKTVKMHDLVRDVALFIASKEEHACLVQHESEMRLTGTNRYKDYKAISLLYEGIEEPRVHLECLKLELLQLKGKTGDYQSLPNNFFEGMKELKVLQLSAIEASPQSLKGLEKLRTLICDSFENIKILGDLGNLEILAIKDWQLQELSTEIGLLRNLRLLDLNGADGLKYFPSGVLPALSKLEELYVSHRFNLWEYTIFDDDDYERTNERTNASLSELEYLHITTLQICVPEPSFLPTHTILASLKRFNIRIGNAVKPYPLGNIRKRGDIHKASVNKLYIEGDASDTEDGSWFNALSRKTEDLTLKKVKNLKNYGFAQLRKIVIDGCDEIEYLVDNKQISRSRDIELARFSNLNKIDIDSCGKLKYVFPLSMARRLSQLQIIRIGSCFLMEGMFCGKEVDDGIEFPNLISLELRFLSKLIGLWADMDNGGCRFLPNQFNDDDAATNLSSTYCKVVSESDSAEKASASNIVNLSSFNYVLFPSTWIRFSNLQEFELLGCVQLEVAFPPNVAEQMVQLKTLQVIGCWQMQYIIGNGRSQEEKYKILVFPNLVELCCVDLQSLVAFCADSNHVFLDCHSLEKITITHCAEIKASMLFEAINEGLSTMITSVPDEDKEVKKAEPSSRTRGLIRRRARKQQKDEVSHINSSTLPMDKSVRETQHHVSSQDHQILFQIVPDFSMLLNIKRLHIEHCHNLIYLFSPHVAKLMVNLKSIRIEYCRKMEGIVAKEDEEAPKSTLGKIVFPQLREIKLFTLPKLRCFYGGIYAMEFPLLESMEFSTSNMKTFSSGSSLSTPLLERITVDGSNISFMGDLNTTVKRLMGEAIKIHDMEHLVRIGHDQFPGGDSSECLFLDIRHCGKLLNAIPYNLIASFQNLKELYVDDCHSLEEIFEYGGGRAMTFSHLERIDLRYLPSLKHILNKVPKEIASFQKLRILEVYKCYALRNVFSVSVARGLLQLQKLVLKECGKLKEVIAIEDEEEEGTSTHQIVFPQLSLIEIKWNLHLECFYSGIYAIEFPLLESLSLFESDYLKSFSNGLVSTPKLEKVNIYTGVISQEEYPVNGDLNATISGWFRNKFEKRQRGRR